MSKKEAVKKIIFFLVVIFSISGILLYLQKLIGLEKIQQFVIDLGIWGPATFVFLVLLTHIFAPVQGTPFVILGFAAFGKWTIIYLYLATLISSFTNFWIARKFGRNIVTKLVGKEAMSKVDHIASHEGVKVLIAARLFQGFITDFISYAAGLTAIKFPPYYLVSILVPIPWTILMFLFFDSIPQQQMFGWLWAVGALLFIVPPTYFYLKHRLVRNHIEHI